MSDTWEKGQTLVDALFGLALLSVLGLSITQITHSVQQMDTFAIMNSDMAALYQQVYAMVSTQQSCTSMFSGQAANTTHAQIQKLAFDNSTSPYLIPIESLGSWSSDPQSVNFIRYGSLVLQKMSLIYAYANENQDLSSPAPSVDLELVINVSLENYQNTIRGIFLTALIDMTQQITQCGPLVYANSQVNFSERIPGCPPNMGPTTLDGTYVECTSIMCESYETPSTDTNGNLVCN